MSISYWQDNSPATQNSSFDAVIIGAGISGLSTAYWLEQEDPSLKIAVIEKAQTGSGATGKNAGFITCGSVEHFNRMVEKWGHDTALEIWNFSEKNLDLLKSHIISDESELEFSRAGSFSLASTESEMKELAATADLMAQKKISVERLNEQEVISRLGAFGFVGGIKYIRDASVNPLKLIKKIKAQLKNTTLFENDEVISFESQLSSQTVLTKTRTNFFSSPLLILATNAYLPTLHPYFQDKVYPTRGQILTTKPVPSFMEGPCYANFVLDYFRQLPSGEVLIGGFRQLEKITEVGYSDHTTDKIQQALADFLDHHLPTLKKIEITHRWAGVMGFSKDGQVFVGSLPDQPQVFFLGGFTAHGLGLAFNTAQILVDAIFGRPIPNFASAKRF